MANHDYRAASCSIPLVFAPALIMSKDPITHKLTEWNKTSLRWIDGSVNNDVPMLKLSQMFHVNHFIVSQVNPHIIPFVPAGEIFLFGEKKERDPDNDVDWFSFLREFATQEMMGQMAILSEVGLLPNSVKKFACIVEQKYYGDINILPKFTQGILPSVYRNPTAEFMIQSRLSGERATWPKLGRIRNHCAVELALEVAVRAMKERLSTMIPTVDREMETHSAALFVQVHESGRPVAERLRRKAHTSGFSNCKSAKGYSAHYNARRLWMSRSIHFREGYHIRRGLLAKSPHLQTKRKLARVALNNAKIWNQKAGRQLHNRTDAETLIKWDPIDEDYVSTHREFSSYTSYSEVSSVGSRSRDGLL